MTLTVGEIADAIKSVAPERESTIERLRHWTREGFIPTLEQERRGTGRHRLYGEDAVFDALVLTTLSDVGFTIAANRPLVMNVLAVARQVREQWAGTKDAFSLVIRHKADGLQRVESCCGSVKDDQTDRVTVEINLSRILAHLERNQTMSELC